MPNLLRLFCDPLVAALCVLSIVAAVYAADQLEDPIAARTANQGDPR